MLGASSTRRVGRLSVLAVAAMFILAVAAMSTGCGTAVDQEEVRAAAQRFSAAASRQDSGAACAELSPALRQQLVADTSGSTCAEAVRRKGLRGGRIARVRVYATSAQVELVGGDTAFLSQTKRGWRIDALGCRPKGPGPYDCEEQA